jgi:hypothetical protein
MPAPFAEEPSEELANKPLAEEVVRARPTPARSASST